MHERVLRDFLAGDVDEEAVARDVRSGTVWSSGRGVPGRIVEMDDAFQVDVPHVVRLCDAVLRGELEAWMLEDIAHCLITCSRFGWAGDTPARERMADAIYDWASPEIAYALTPATVDKFRLRISTGEDRFTPADRPPRL